MKLLKMNKDNYNFIFWGTPHVASDTLEILKNNGFLPTLIITSPDKPAGRGLHLTPSPTSLWADENEIPCLKPEKIDDEFISKLSTFDSQLSVVVAYGKILPEKIINLPKLGTINIHYSLLPKYRGASPLESCLLNGDKETGISIQQMIFKLDSGPILFKKEVPIEMNDTKDILKDKLIKIGGQTLSEIFPKIFNEELHPILQNEEKATRCGKIKKEDGLLNLDADAQKNYNKYRAFYGWPGTYFFVNEKRIKITKARYENDSFIIEKVIPQGKKEINYTDFIRNN